MKGRIEALASKGMNEDFIPIVVLNVAPGTYCYGSAAPSIVIRSPVVIAFGDEHGQALQSISMGHFLKNLELFTESFTN